MSSDGRDISSTITQGRLGGLLEVRAGALTELLGDATQTGSLNTLAKSFADRVNQILTGGLASEGPPAVAGTALFSYDAARPTAIAATLAVAADATPEGLAAISPGPPTVSNGAALDLAALRTAADAPGGVDGLSYLQFFGKLGGRVGAAIQEVGAAETRAGLLATQARDLRNQISGVSLDQEAIELLQTQRSFDASARMVQVVDDLVQSVLSMLR